MKKTTLIRMFTLILIASSATSGLGQSPAELQRADREVELKQLREIYGKVPEDFDKWPKVRRRSDVGLKGDTIEGSWLVELIAFINPKQVRAIADEIAKTYNAKVEYVIANKRTRQIHLSHFFAPDKLAEDPRVRRIYEDSKIIFKYNDFDSIPNTPINPPAKRPSKPVTKPKASTKALMNPFDINAQRPVVTKDYAPDRIDTNQRIYDGYHTYTFTGASAREPVDMYFIDSGIKPNLSEFGGRAILWKQHPDGVDTDCVGHGTRVASKAAGNTVGVAPGAKILALQTTLCRPNMPTEGIPFTMLNQWLYELRDRVIANRPRGAILNISLTVYDYFGLYPFLDTALSSVIGDADVPVTVAVGQDGDSDINSDHDHTHYWPLRVNGVLRVGMTDRYDRRVDTTAGEGPPEYVTGISCNGRLLRDVTHYSGTMLFAPAGPYLETHPQTGQILVTECGPATIDRLGNRVYIGGTSYAAPLTAGAIAQFLSANGGTTFPRYWIPLQALLDTSTTGLVTYLDYFNPEPNKLLYSYFPVTDTINAASGEYGVAQDSLVSAYAPFSAPPTQVVLCVNPSCAPTYNCSIPTGGSLANQVNFLVPAGLAGEVYSLKALRNNQIMGYGWLRVLDVAPGVFTLSGASTGPAVAQLDVRRKSDGTQIAVYNIPSAGVSWDTNVAYAYLIVYGTGWRYHNGNNVVQLKKQGGSTIYSSPIDFQIYFAGPAGSPGLDQVFIGPLPEPLKGAGTWEFKFYVSNTPGQFNGYLANVATVKFN